MSDVSLPLFRDKVGKISLIFLLLLPTATVAVLELGPKFPSFYKSHEVTDDITTQKEQAVSTAI